MGLVQKLSWLALVLLAIVAVSRCQRKPFDGIDVDTVLRNDALVKRQINCLNCKGPCDRIGGELKRVLPIVARNNCASCSPQERANLGKIINHAQSRYPQEWQGITQMVHGGRRC